MAIPPAASDVPLRPLLQPQTSHYKRKKATSQGKLLFSLWGQNSDNFYDCRQDQQSTVPQPTMWSNNFLVTATCINQNRTACLLITLLHVSYNNANVNFTKPQTPQLLTDVTHTARFIHTIANSTHQPIHKQPILPSSTGTTQVNKKTDEPPFVTAQFLDCGKDERPNNSASFTQAFIYKR